MTSLLPVSSPVITPAPTLNADQARAVEAPRQVPLQALAGAGAGKTFVMAHRMVKLLRDLAAEGIDAPQTRILAVTFTVKAAAEMRARIQRTLGEERLDDEAAISNFHGFCNRLLRRHALAVGLPPGFTILAGLEQRVLTTRLQQHLHMGDYPDIGDILTQAGLSQAIAPQTLSLAHMRALPVTSLSALIDDLPALLSAIKSSGLSPRQFHALAHAQARDLTQALLTLPQTGIDGAYLSDCQAYADCWDRHLAPWTAPGGAFVLDNAARTAFEPENDDWEKVYQDRLKWLSQWPAFCEAGKLPLFAHRYRGKFRRLAHESDTTAVLAQIGADEARLIDWTAAAYALYQETLRRQGTCDFDDLINHTLTLFERRPDILASLQQQFEAIIVDEFQDSNGSQLALLRRLLRPECPALTVVGDLKQSIYRFRHARPENMERIFEGMQPLRITLRENYRSVAPILAIANVLAEQIVGDDRQRLTCGQAPASGPSSAPAVVWVELGLADPERPGKRLKESAQRLRAREADWMAATIARLIADGEAQPKEITVLVKAHHKAEGLQRALRALGVPVITRKNAGFFEEPVILDAMALLGLMHHPGDHLAWTRVLQKKLSQRQLLQLRHQARAHQMSFYGALRALDDTACWPELPISVRSALLSLIDDLRVARAMARRADVASAFARLADRVGLVDTEAPIDVRQAQHVSLQAFGRLLHQWAHQRLDASGAPVTLAEIVQTLQAAREEGTLELPLSQGPPEEDALNAVQVMTIHVAKGLENEIVFVAYADAKARRRMAGLLRFDPMNASDPGDPGFGLMLTQHPLSADKGQATLKKRLYQNRWDGPQAEAEEKRLFYVAVTRARRRLIVVRSDQAPDWTAASAFPPDVQAQAMTILSEADDPQAVLRDIPRGADALALCDAVRARLQPVSAKVSESAMADAPVLATADAPETSPASPVAVRADGPVASIALSFSALQTLHQCPTRYWLSAICRLPEPPVAAGDDSGAAQAVGQAVHALIEQHYLARGSLSAAQRAHCLQTFLPRDIPHADVARARAEALFDGFLTSPYTMAALQARGLTPIPETRLRFAWPSPATLVDATVDLLLRDANGQTHAVVEFKTNEILNDTHLATYTRQLALYRLGLKACGLADDDLADDRLILAHLTPQGVHTRAIAPGPETLVPLRALAQTAQALHATAAIAPARPETVDCQRLHCPYLPVCPRALADRAGAP